LLQAKNSANYFALLNYMFSTTDGANAAGIRFVAFFRSERALTLQFARF
jgi:hypothetical protein